LWTSLADYYIRRSMFEKARDVYEEGLCSVITVHDFSLIYDAYTQVRGRSCYGWSPASHVRVARKMGGRAAHNAHGWQRAIRRQWGLG
jgi:hypothetical protein